jgi:hypothetical protein
MLKPGTKVRMTKGYKSLSGIIMEVLDSQLEFYIIKLENNIQIVAGTSAFTIA